MRTTEEIMADFDNPDGTSSVHDSAVSSIRGRVLLETMLDVRQILYQGLSQIKDVLEEIRDK